MARRRIAAQRTVKSLGSIQLQAYPQAEPTERPSTQMLTTGLFTDQNAQRVSRQRFGRSISMDRIETALVGAYRGSMRDITDLSRETIDADPHLASVLQKRFGSLASLPYEVQPATGPGIDPDRAMYYAEVVREQLRSIKKFRETLYQLAWALFDNRAANEIHWMQVLPGQTTTSQRFGDVGLVVESLAWIHPRRLSYGPHRELRIQDERVQIGGNFSDVGLALNDIPDKFIQWTPSLFGEYAEREGLAQRCMYWSFFKRFSARERMILLELFGKPWRILEVDEESSAGGDELSAADEVIDNLGASYTARMPRGTKLHVEQPQKTAGAIHDDVIKSSNSEISTLVLGQTGTTDGIQVGLNGGAVMDGMVNEQLGILIRDAAMLDELVETQLTDRMVALNFGEAAVTHAPRFVMRADRPTDKVQELTRLKGALDSGLSVKLEEAYEISGFSMPDLDRDTVLTIEQPPTPPAAANPPAPRPVRVFPVDQSPSAGEQLPPPAVGAVGEEGAGGPQAPVSSGDTATITTVEEARRAAGLEPFGDERDSMTVADFEKAGNSLGNEVQEDATAGDDLRAAEEAGRDAATQELDEEDGLQITTLSRRLVASYGAKADDIAGLVQVDDIAAVVALSRRRAFEFAMCGGNGYPQTEAGYVALIRDHEQPASEFGSVERILEKSQVATRSVMRKMANAYADNIDAGQLSSLGIFNAINATHQTFDTQPFARELERRMLHALMLGALDSAREALTDDDAIGTADVDEIVEESNQLKGVLTSKVLLADPGDVPNFTEMRFADATKFFKEQNVVTRAQFDLMSAEAKRQAFTVAGVANDQMLQEIRSELSRQIASGSDFKDFTKVMDARLKASGFLAQAVEIAPGVTAMSASHVETVFRTNVLNAYNQGRATQQSSPAMLTLRPVWEFRATLDKATRTPHRDAAGKMLAATDPFWTSAYPPYGFNCRCRVVTRGRRYLDQIVLGSTISGLPDKGFTSGTTKGL